MDKDMVKEKKSYKNGTHFIGFVPDPIPNNRDIWSRTHIWVPFFEYKGDKGSKKWDDLKYRLDENNIEDSPLASRISGGRVWGEYGRKFLNYRNNYDRYMEMWWSKPLSLNGCLQLFSEFRCSIPTAKPDKYGQLVPDDLSYAHTAKFLPAAIRICEFLKDVEAYYKLPCHELPQNKHDEKWANAGLYSVICLFLQNGAGKPAFYYPPSPYDPDSLKEILKQHPAEGVRHSEATASSNILNDVADPETDTPSIYEHAQESFGAPEKNTENFALDFLMRNGISDDPSNILINPMITETNAPPGHERSFHPDAVEIRKNDTTLFVFFVHTPADFEAVAGNLRSVERILFGPYQINVPHQSSMLILVFDSFAVQSAFEEFLLQNGHAFEFPLLLTNNTDQKITQYPMEKGFFQRFTDRLCNISKRAFEY